MSEMDPQVQSSLISAAGGVITGLLGGKWWHSRQRVADERCEKICGLMVNSFDKLLTALEVAGEPPVLKVAVRDARDSIVTAKNYLGLSGAELVIHKSVE